MSKAEETRNYIIEQAAPIFNMYGYNGTTMSQLTRAISMTPRSRTGALLRSVAGMGITVSRDHGRTDGTRPFRGRRGGERASAAFVAESASVAGSRPCALAPDP